MLAASLSALSTTPAAAPAPAAPAAPSSGEGSFAHKLDQARQAPPHAAKPPKDAPRADKAGTPSAQKAEQAGKAEVQPEDGPKATDEASPDTEDKAAAADAQTPTSPDLAHLLPGWTPPQRSAGTRAEAAPPEGSAEDNADGVAARGPRGKALPGAATDVAAAQGRRGAADKADGSRPAGFAAELSAAQGDKAAGAERPAPAQSPALPTADAASAGAALATTQHTAGAGTTAGAQRGEAPRFEAQLSAAVGSPEFAPALGVQVSILAREGVQEARLHLNPADMGPISVQIAVNGTQAEVNFQADVAATRQALESSLPDLAAALRDSGLTMSGGGVSEQPRDTGRQAAAGDDSGRGTGGRGRGPRDEGGVDGIAGPAAGARVARPQGVVDLYA